MSLSFFLALFPKLIEGTWVTIVLLIVSGIFGNALAIPVALGRVSRNPIFYLPSSLFVLVMRGTPLLVQIYLLYYGLGDLFSHTPQLRQSVFWPYLREGFWYAALALSLNQGGYSGEVLRGAILAVPKGEIEAARAFAMSHWLILRRIILPRAIRICLPTMAGETILLLKATALASTITVMDTLGTANLLRLQTFRVYEPLLAAAIIYVALTFIITRVFYWVERRLNRDRLPPAAVMPKASTVAQAA